MAFNCGTWFGKTTLCIVNFIFLISGVTVLIFAIWMATDKNSLISVLRMVDNEHINPFFYPRVFEHLSHVWIVIGSIMFVISFIGYCGTKRESSWMLLIYGIIMIIILVAEIIVVSVAMVFRNKSRDQIKQFLTTTIKTYYARNEEGKAITKKWNRMMSEYCCCGVDDFRDFYTSQAWITYKGDRVLPEACCKLKDVANLIPKDKNCLRLPNEENSFYQKGCYEAFSDWTDSNRNVIYGVVFSVIILQLVAIITAFCLSKKFKKS